MTPRLVLAVLLPFVACGAQWLLWDAYLKPYVWFLFFPAAFFSAWLGGLRGGLAGTAVSALLVWYFFIPPAFSFALKDISALFSIVIFVVMGGLFAWLFERLKQALRNTEAALAETRAANDKITELYEKTKELDKLKSQFFANVSHELRTPLTLIMAPLEQRLRRPAAAEFSDRREDEMMLRNARLLYRQVSDLLDAAKLEAGGMQAHYSELDLAELVRATAAHFDSVARERGIDYRVAAPVALPAEADGEKVQRILLNLLSNAFKFAPDGGAIAVRLSTTGAMHDGALLEVQDNGPGVPAELREAVFERFRQVEGGTRRRHGGTGLGLSIVREFAELLGGDARVDAAPGGGARFAVRLPLRAPAGAVIHAAPSRIDATLDRQTLEELAAPTADVAASDTPATHDAPLVLVVEDNADMSAFIVDSLRPYYRVASARDGRAGLEKALALAPDLILADVMMPTLGGDEMVLALRGHPEMAGVPIVMLTAKADDELRVKLLKAGVQSYLSKPFAVAELLARVEGLVRERLRIGARLRDSETRFEATFEQAAVGIVQMAPDGHFLRANRKLCEFLGYAPAELLERTLRDITYADDLADSVEHVRRMLAGAIEGFSLEKRYLRRDGRIVWGNVSASMVRRKDGTPDYMIAVVEDIDARKAAEDELKRRNGELQRFDRAAVGREIEMIRLKRQVNALSLELGRTAPFALDFADPGGDA